MKMEQRQPNGKPWVCAECGKAFPFQSVLLNHTRIHSGEKPFECEYCNKKFAQKTSLIVHTRQHTGQKPYVCEYCGKGFASQGNMKIHERRHTGEKPYSCKVCPKSFSTIGSLKTHEISHSSELGEMTESFLCDECGKTFSYRSSIYAHKKRHETKRKSMANSVAGSNNDNNSSCSLNSSSNNNNNNDSSGTGRTNGDNRKWSCRFCDKRFMYRHPLVAHERTHTGERPFVCPYCEKRFTQQTTLIMHVRSHTGERRYKCDICEKRFIQPAALRSHMRTHSREKPFVCEICNKAFGHATSLRQHKFTHLKNGRTKKGLVDSNSTSSTADQSSGNGWDFAANGLFKMLADEPAPKPSSSTKRSPSQGGVHVCPYCGKTFAYMCVMKAHLRVHTGEKPFQCNLCGKRFAQKATMIVHARTHSGDKPYKCQHCDRTFAQYSSKSVHEITHVNSTAYSCPLCNKVLSSPSALYTHKQTHGERRFQCTQCPKTFTLKNYLKLHMVQVHVQCQKQHQCIECGKVFAYAGSLTIHMRSHNGEKPYKCRICSKGFSSQGNMRSHERIHFGIRPYTCKICDKSFVQRNQLIVHESVHGEKVLRTEEFGCKYCDKKFTFKSRLIVHVRHHTGERPFKCRFCDKTFSSKGNLQVHERVHTKERPYRCVGCHKSFSQKAGLKAHCKRCSDYKHVKRLWPQTTPIGGIPAGAGHFPPSLSLLPDDLLASVVEPADTTVGVFSHVDTSQHDSLLSDFDPSADNLARLPVFPAVGDICSTTAGFASNTPAAPNVPVTVTSEERTRVRKRKPVRKLDDVLLTEGTSNPLHVQPVFSSADLSARKGVIFSSENVIPLAVNSVPPNIDYSSNFPTLNALDVCITANKFHKFDLSNCQPAGVGASFQSPPATGRRPTNCDVGRDNFFSRLKAEQQIIIADDQSAAPNLSDDYEALLKFVYDDALQIANNNNNNNDNGSISNLDNNNVSIKL